MRRMKEAVVVGAGIAGASTALELARRGLSVQLIDAWEPGHARAASAGDHRILRSSHGADELYASWSREARLRWLELGQEVGATLFVEAGCLLMAHEADHRWEDASRETLARLGIPHFTVSAEEIALRLPLVDPRGLAFGLWEPESGFIFARRALLATLERFHAEGGELIRGRVITGDDERPQLDGRLLEADVIVMACGAWMAQLFRRTLFGALEIIRQDVITVAPPAGSRACDWTNMPAWIDHGYPAYGIPAADGLGFKPVIVWEALTVDLDRDDRVVVPASAARSRRYLAHRFPSLAGQPIVGIEVGQIANTRDTHFIIDRHPSHEDIVLVAGDSGHLFKHGPVLGSYVADLAQGRIEVDPRFRCRDRSTVDLVNRPQ
jgi:sarcosine oxidase